MIFRSNVRKSHDLRFHMCPVLCRRDQKSTLKPLNFLLATPASSTTYNRFIWQVQVIGRRTKIWKKTQILALSWKEIASDGQEQLNQCTVAGSGWNISVNVYSQARFTSSWTARLTSRKELQLLYRHPQWTKEKLSEGKIGQYDQMTFGGGGKVRHPATRTLCQGLNVAVGASCSRTVSLHWTE